MKKLSCILVFVIIGISACKNESGTISSNFILGDTVLIKAHETLINRENEISLRMDSVLEDSRCPTDVVCVWAGNAKVRFVFKSNSDEIKFSLNTTLTPRDTTINGYKIRLLDLLPHPVSTHRIPNNEYYANITIQKN